MPTPFSSQDISRLFDARVLTRGRSLGLAGGVDVNLEGDTISAVVKDGAISYNVQITPSLLGQTRGVRPSLQLPRSRLRPSRGHGFRGA